jgi:predicted lactoylglutathione lyase
MVALEAEDKDQVQRIYDIALANGGTCEGPPGLRGASFYAGYFRDPDGNKLNAFLMTG